jgi:uncharacterized protein (DUF433 family)
MIMMELVAPAEPVPLHRDSDGVWRVAGTRVPLERVLESYQAGRTPEQIAEAFDSLPLAAIYQVIGYCLSHPDVVQAYLAEGEAQAARVREQVEARQQPSHAAFRETIRVRQGQPGNGHAPTGQ